MVGCKVVFGIVQTVLGCFRHVSTHFISAGGCFESCCYASSRRMCATLGASERSSRGDLSEDSFKQSTLLISSRQQSPLSSKVIGDFLVGCKVVFGIVQTVLGCFRRVSTHFISAGGCFESCCYASSRRMCATLGASERSSRGDLSEDSFKQIRIARNQCHHSDTAVSDPFLTSDILFIYTFICLIFCIEHVYIYIYIFFLLIYIFCACPYNRIHITL